MAQSKPRRAPAKRTPAKPRAPLFAKPEAKAKTSTRSGGPGIHGSARIEINLIKLGSVISTSRTVNRNARRGGFLGGLFKGLQGASAVIAKGVTATADKSGGRKSGKGDSASFDRFKDSRPDLFGPGEGGGVPEVDARPHAAIAADAQWLSRGGAGRSDAPDRVGKREPTYEADDTPGPQQIRGAGGV